MAVVLFRSKNLLFRPLERSDAIRLFELHAQPEVLKFLGIPVWEKLEESVNYILSSRRSYEHNGFGRWVVERESDQAWLGVAGLIVDPYDQFIDLGYRFFPKYWGRGIATESAKAVLNYGFNELGIEEIEARVALQNAPSIRVLEKVGMQYMEETTCMGVSALAYKLKTEEFSVLNQG